MQKKTKLLALYGMYVALAMILSYVECMIPMQGMVPGMKLGLTNVVVLVALYTLSAKGAVFINLARIFFVAFTFGNAFSLWYSLAGGLLAFFVMYLLKKTEQFQVTTVSVAGSVAHNAGQLCVAAIILQTKTLLWYFGVLCVTGVITGIAIGLLGSYVMVRIAKIV